MDQSVLVDLVSHCHRVLAYYRQVEVAQCCNLVEEVAEDWCYSRLAVVVVEGMPDA